ncbi:hypothetical protein ACFWE5_07250 [Cellulosimicrobium funkei]|uniref:hypothetical protein n=1 Tax=Cellulosimicrobium funkei TaxID=264251 RepID=UPI00366175BC
MAEQIETTDQTLTKSPQHLGRSWTGHQLEDACPCPQAACGLVSTDAIDPTCDQHALDKARTMRQVHDGRACTHLHVVTVTIYPADPDAEDARPTVDRVAFTCSAPDDADCRNTPDCDCEAWYWNDDKTADQSGHPRVPGQPCWVASWFDSTDSAVYAGDDMDDRTRDDCVPAIERSGPIDVTWCDGYIEWTWRDGHDVQVEQLDLGARGEEASRG